MAGRNITVTQLYDKVAIAALTESERQSRCLSIGNVVYEYMAAKDIGVGYSLSSATQGRRLVSWTTDSESNLVFSTENRVFNSDNFIGFKGSFDRGLGLLGIDEITTYTTGLPNTDIVCFLALYSVRQNKQVLCWAYRYKVGENGVDKIRFKTSSTWDAVDYASADFLYVNPFGDPDQCICMTSLGGYSDVPEPLTKRSDQSPFIFSHGYYLTTDVAGSLHCDYIGSNINSGMAGPPTPTGIIGYTYIDESGLPFSTNQISGTSASDINSTEGDGLVDESGEPVESSETEPEPTDGSTETEPSATEADSKTYNMLTLEPYVATDGNGNQELKVSYMSLSSDLYNNEYPYLVGTVVHHDTLGEVVRRMLFISDIESLPPKTSNETYVAFCIMPASAPSSVKPALIPGRLDGPDWVECAVYAGNAAKSNEWFCAGSTGSVNGPDPFTATDISGSIPDTTPNNYIRYTAWSQGATKPSFDDINGISWAIEGEEDGVSTITLTKDSDQDTRTVTLHHLHKITDSLNNSPVVVDNEYYTGETAVYPYYITCLVEEDRKKEVLTTGVLSTFFSDTFSLPILPEEYSDDTYYNYGSIVLYKAPGDTSATAYMFYQKTKESQEGTKGIPPTNEEYWTSDIDVDREESISVHLTNLGGITETESSTAYASHLVNTRAMCRVDISGTGITLPDPSTIVLPDESGQATIPIKKDNSLLCTNYYSDDDKNGRTQIHLVYNLYRGTVRDDTTLIRSSVFSTGLFDSVALIKANIFTHKTDEQPDTKTNVAVIDDTAVEPLTPYTYVLTYGFGSVSGGTIFSDEYICDYFDAASGIGLFKYGVQTPFLGFGETQEEEAVADYMDEVTGTRSMNIPPAAASGSYDGTRYLYVVLGEYQQGEGFGTDSFPLSAPIDDADILHDVNATIVAHAYVPQAYVRFAPSFSGEAFLSFVDADGDDAPADDLYTANRPSVIALIQNENTVFELPSITWRPQIESGGDGYHLFLFVISSAENLGEKFPDLLHNAHPFSFRLYQVLAEAKIPAVLKDLECELDVTFNLSFN